LVANEPDSPGTDVGNAQADHRADSRSDFFAPRTPLSRGFDAYTPSSRLSSEGDDGPSYSHPGVSRTHQTQQTTVPLPNQKEKRKGWFGWRRQPVDEVTSVPPPVGQPWQPSGHDAGYPPVPGMPVPEMPGMPMVPERPAPRFWEKQPYAAIAHLLALSGTLTVAWLFGILAAQILPGSFEKPPLQESVLRKSSRLTRQLSHLPQLWHSPTVETQITAIPLPTTGPVVGAVELSPIERQPLMDELNAIETEVLTLDRRLQTLEKRLGQPPYQGADVENRINSLRNAMDPPIREQIKADYEPVPSDPSDRLLDVARLKITLPSDALFTPGQSGIKDAPLLTQVLDQLVNYPDSTILVRSYSDNQAGVEASRRYTLEQANAIARYLQSALPTNHRWVTLGGGQTQPITDNADPVQRQQNRRIEILVDTRS